MRRLFLFVFLAGICLHGFSQDVNERIRLASQQMKALEQQTKELGLKLEDLKLEKIRKDLVDLGLPAVRTGEKLVQHQAYYLSFVPQYKEARWVAHIILPDVTNGLVFRTNDFRVDSAVSSAVEEDYFLKSMKPDSSILYDGFGYDRGHLAPSADFRWSQKALSESYFYSNMAPQLADFNRGGWGDLEDAIRGYLYRHPGVQLAVVTGPVLEDHLPVIERGRNKLPIPKQFWKVVIDLQNKKGIGFIMPNEPISKPLKSFAVPINTVESLTGLDFFSKLPPALQEQLESQQDPADWLPESNNTDVEALSQENLPRGHFNTSVARQWINRNEEIWVCGTVVGARISRAGNILLNLDKQFPNQVFTVFIKKEDIVNFSYKPEDLLKGKIICVKGKVMDQGGTATMYVQNESGLTINK